MFEMIYKGQPILVYDVMGAIKEGLKFKKKSITLYKGVSDDTLVRLELNSGIEYKVLLDYLECGWKIL
jgi:hypothetical protein